MPLTQMRAETFATAPLPASTFTVPAQQIVPVPIIVLWPQGATLEGTYSISGGRNDVDVSLVAPPSTVLVSSGRVSVTGQFRQKLAPGRYSIVFDNRFSTFTPKSISSDLKLVYYK
jgi:hypothetical protein